MKVLLIKDTKNVGKKGDVKEVSDGYAMNYLIKQGFAVIFNAETKRQYELELQRQAKELENRKQEAIALKERLEKITLTFYGVPNRNGYLTGTVSVKDIRKKLENEHSIKLDKTMFAKSTLVNTFGLNHVDVELFKGVKAVVNVNVVQQNNK